MHDFYTAKAVLDKVIQTARRHKLERVQKVEIELGRLEDHGEAITPQNLSFNFKLLAKDTVAQKAKLVIRRIPGAYFRVCALEGSGRSLKVKSDKLKIKKHSHKPMSQF